VLQSHSIPHFPSSLARLGEEAAAQLKSEGCDVRFLPLDIGNSESINNFKHLVQSEYPGGVDVLVNNAAIA
jgi:NAD(P)-dependent dehydrogenase (short-subunit alcohol dehydrogenase family)